MKEFLTIVPAITSGLFLAFTAVSGSLLLFLEDNGGTPGRISLL